MRLSEIGNKEIVDLSTGCSHGRLWDAEIIFEKKTGKIKAVQGDLCDLAWNSIVIIGDDMIIFQSAATS